MGFEMVGRTKGEGGGGLLGDWVACMKKNLAGG